MPNYHFISGLPRAGSTLLSAILLQNPRFHAGMTNPLEALYSGMLQQFGAGTEFGPVITIDERRGLVRGLYKVRPAASLQARQTILPPDLFAPYSKLSFWKDTAGSRANVLAVKSPAPEPVAMPTL
jgi:hypothetical protein